MILGKLFKCFNKPKNFITDFYEFDFDDFLFFIFKVLQEKMPNMLYMYGDFNNSYS